MRQHRDFIFSFCERVQKEKISPQEAGGEVESTLRGPLPGPGRGGASFFFALSRKKEDFLLCAASFILLSLWFFFFSVVNSSLR